MYMLLSMCGSAHDCARDSIIMVNLSLKVIVIYRSDSSAAVNTLCCKDNSYTTIDKIFTLTHTTGLISLCIANICITAKNQWLF